MNNMAIIKFFEEDIPEWVFELNESLGKEKITEEEVWNHIRRLEKVPHVGNEFARLVFVRYKEILEDNQTFEVVSFEGYINALNTDLNIKISKDGEIYEFFNEEVVL